MEKLKIKKKNPPVAPPPPPRVAPPPPRGGEVEAPPPPLPGGGGEKKLNRSPLLSDLSLVHEAGDVEDVVKAGEYGEGDDGRVNGREINAV